MNKILVIDDEVDILRMIKMILERRNFIVETVSKWQEISTAVENFKPDLILLDISLGGADGREICKRLKSDEKTSNIHIILFSANYGIEKTLPDSKADGFIPKPFEPAHLISTIQTALA